MMPTPATARSAGQLAVGRVDLHVPPSAAADARLRARRDASARQDDPGQHDGDECRVRTAVADVTTTVLAGLAAQQANDAGQSADAGEAERV